MRPKTKIQKDVVRLRKKYPKPNSYQINWAYKNLFKHYVYVTDKNNTCLECNHVWSGKYIRCPNCKTKLTNLNEEGKKKRTITDNFTFAVYDTYKGFQIIRYIYVQRTCKSNKKPEWFWNTIVEHWINEINGSHVIIARLVSMFGYYRRCQFNLSSEMEVRGDSNTHYIFPDGTYPKIKLIDNLFRNGYDGSNTYDYHDAYFFHLILSSTAAETLLKTRNIELFKKMVPYEKEINIFWHAIKICFRHNYDIMKDFTMWIDYMKYLHYFKKDTHNPQFICPKNLKKEHDKWMDKKAKIDHKIFLEKQAKWKLKEEERLKQQEIERQDKLKKVYKIKKKYFDISIPGDGFNLIVLKSLEEYREEGKLMHHCLGDSYWMDNKSLILSARNNNKRLATIELSIPNAKILQCRGNSNSKPKIYDKVINLIEDNKTLFIKPKRIKRNAIQTINVI